MGARTIPVQEAAVGMVLAQPVADDQGRVIVGAGTALTTVHLNRLPRWGVGSISIEDGTATAQSAGVGLAPEALPAQPDPVETDEEVSAALGDRFKEVADDPNMQTLKAAALRVLSTSKRSSPPAPD